MWVHIDDITRWREDALVHKVLFSPRENKLFSILQVSSLYAMYEECTFAWSDIDERDFIKSEPHLFVSDDR